MMLLPIHSKQRVRAQAWDTSPTGSQQHSSVGKEQLCFENPVYNPSPAFTTAAGDFCFGLPIILRHFAPEQRILLQQQSLLVHINVLSLCNLFYHVIYFNIYFNTFYLYTRLITISSPISGRKLFRMFNLICSGIQFTVQIVAFKHDDLVFFFSRTAA